VQNTAFLYIKYGLPLILFADQFKENKDGGFPPNRANLSLRKGGKTGERTVGIWETLGK
jgi:hypothetical protein